MLFKGIWIVGIIYDTIMEYPWKISWKISGRYFGNYLENTLEFLLKRIKILNRTLDNLMMDDRFNVQ